MSARGGSSGSGAGKLVYAFIGARGKIVCEYTADPIQAPPGISKSGLQIHQRLRDDGQYSFPLDNSLTSYAQVSNGTCYGAVGVGALKQPAVISTLQDIRDAFTMGGSNASTFMPAMKRTIDSANAKFTASDSKSKINQVNAQVMEVKEVMVQNIDKVLERGERLDDVLVKSDAMKDSAAQFRNSGRKLRRQMWCQNCKLWAALIAILIVVVIVIFFAVCGGTSCLS